MTVCVVIDIPHMNRSYISFILNSGEYARGSILEDKLEARDFFDLIIKLAGNENNKNFS
jgi:hypothetical protein